MYSVLYLYILTVYCTLPVHLCCWRGLCAVYSVFVDVDDEDEEEEEQQDPTHHTHHHTDQVVTL